MRSLPQAICDGVKGMSLVLSLWQVRSREFTMFSASLMVAVTLKGEKLLQYGGG